MTVHFNIINKNLFNHLTDDENCDFEFGPLEELAANGEVMVYKHLGNWDCVDHERDLARLNKLWAEKNPFWKV